MVFLSLVVFGFSTKPLTMIRLFAELSGHYRFWKKRKCKNHEMRNGPVMMNIPTVTAANWERGRRQPTGAAPRLLDIARRHPEVLVA
jgi:hypothetical protein